MRALSPMHYLTDDGERYCLGLRIRGLVSMEEGKLCFREGSWKVIAITKGNGA